jgi:uncharacterized membrane protein
MDMSSSRLLGIIGALFMIIGFLPSVGWLLMLIGIIFVLIAIKGYGDAYKDESIFHNTLYTIVFEIVGVVVFLGVVIFGLMSFLSSVGINNITQLSSWQNINWQQAISTSNFLPFIGAIILGLVILFAFTVIASLYFRKAMKTLSEKTGVKLFRTTGTVFFVGALLTIIIIGIIVIWVSFILLLISFYESKAHEQMQQPQQQTPP